MLLLVEISQRTSESDERSDRVSAWRRQISVVVMRLSNQLFLPNDINDPLLSNLHAQDLSHHRNASHYLLRNSAESELCEEGVRVSAAFVPKVNEKPSPLPDFPNGQ